MDDLTEIEASLRHALGHRSAPNGFASRVMSRLSEDRGRTALEHARQQRPATLLRVRLHSGAAWWSAAAAALLLALGGGNAVHIRNQNQAKQAQVAESQVDFAMQLTSHALTEVNSNLDRSHAGRFTYLWNDTQQ